MSTRSTLFVLLAFACVAAIIIEDASAWRRRCGRRFSRCGVSRSASWGGSYGSVGSCGTPVSSCRARVCSQVPTQPCSISFGSNGGSGGSYASVGSVGGMVIISDVLLSTTLNEPGNQASESIVSPSGELDSATVDNPIDIIVPEHQPPAGTVLENDPSPHLHIDDGAASKTSNGSGAAARDNTTSHRATTNTAVVSRIAQPADLHAFLVLRDVPRDAEVYLLGVKMTARGELRRYRIPLLASDVQYDYQVELRLPVDGDRSAEVVTQVSAGVTTELWVARAGNRLVLQDQQNVQSESLPLAVN